MAKTSLTIKDLLGDLFDKYEPKYQAILKKFNDENAIAEQFRDDLKNKKLAENKQTALTQAKVLAETFKKELITRLTNKRDEFIKTQEGKQSTYTTELEAAFSNTYDNTKALKFIYDAAEENARLLKASKILEFAYIPSIEKLVDDNLNNDDILEIVEAYIKSHPEKMNEFNKISSKLEEAKKTEVDYIDELLGIVRYMSANSDLFPVIDIIGGLSSRNISNDFTKFDNDIAKSFYFG